MGLTAPVDSVMPSTAILATLVACIACLSTREAHAFAPPTEITSIVTNAHAAPTTLFGKRRKPSMKERRKQRAKKQPGFTVDRGLLNELPPVDSWEKTEPTVAATTAPAASDAESAGGVVDESEATNAKASSLVQSQRKSVDNLTFIRKRVEESFPMNEAAQSIVERGYFVHDSFLSSDEDSEFGDALLAEMLQEGSDMLSNDKLERDISRLGDGEYVARIVGGEDYASCPRLTEYVVSLTRHLPPLLNKELDALEAGDVSRLDSAASMGTLRFYDRKTRLGAESLFAKPETGDDGQDRPFGIVCGDSDGTEDDSRRLTAMFYLSPTDWDGSVCGGGVAFEQGEKLDAIRDRLVLVRSDTCSHRQVPWKGDDKAGLEQAGCAIVHFVKGSAD